MVWHHPLKSIAELFPSMEPLTCLGTFTKLAVKCLSCGKNLTGSTILGYPHKEGEIVNGVRLWLFVECRYCSYQNSFKKLGLSFNDADVSS